MPTKSVGGQVEFDVRPRFVSSVMTTSTVASVLTLTVLLAFVGVM